MSRFQAPAVHRLPDARRAGIALLAVALLGAAAIADAGIMRDLFAKVSGKSSAAPAKTASGELPTFPRPGFTCCNLRYDDDEISDSSDPELSILKAGTPVTVLGYGKNRANLDVEGKPMILEHEYGRDQEVLDTWVNKIVVSEDPRPRIASWPANIQAAIRAGKLVRGMTRQQALAAVGYPRANVTKSIDEDVWRMFLSRGEYQVHFGTDGRLATITGDGEVTSQVIYLAPPSSR